MKIAIRVAIFSKKHPRIPKITQVLRGFSYENGNIFGHRAIGH
jgi:hypothetical protein